MSRVVFERKCWAFLVALSVLVLHGPVLSYDDAKHYISVWSAGDAWIATSSDVLDSSTKVGHSDDSHKCLVPCVLQIWTGVDSKFPG